MVLDTDPETQNLIRGSFESKTYETVEQARVLANDETAAALTKAKETAAPRLPFRTRSALIVLLVCVGLVLYPSAFKALLWIFEGLFTLSLLITLTVVSVWFSEKRKARRK